MLDFLNALFQSLAPLWEMSVTAAYAAAVVMILRLLLKKRAPRQVLCLLWLVVFARLLIPVSLESPLSIVPNALPGQEQQIHLPNQPSDAEHPVTPIQPQNPAQNITPNQPANDAVTPVTNNPAVPSLSVPEGVTPAAPQPEAPASFPWQAALAGVWLAGAVLMAAYALFFYLRLRRCLFDAIRAKDGAWEHPAVNSPFILGFVRPRIYLPAGLAGQPRRFILCHERAHLRRLDHIVKPICWVALALHWFNPMVWAAYILMSRDIEAACDEAVIRRLGPQVKADYSATLLALATNGRVPAPCPLAFDEGNAKGRIKNVLRYRRPALWIVVVSVIAAVLAAVCLLTDPVAAKAPDDDPNADPSPDASASQEPVDLADTLLDPWMKELLDGGRTFRSTYNEEQNYTINDLRSFYYGDDQNLDAVVEVSKLAIIDLDRDGINEMVVDPEKEFLGYLILRRQGDELYGYAPGYRSFESIKADGTFHWSGGTGYHGTGSAQFTENGFEITQLIWCEVLSADNGAYFVNGLSATQEEFDAAIAAQNAKPEPTWYVFEDGQLKPLSSASASAINIPIPLDDDVTTGPVPDFLDADQQLLYRRALTMYRHIFGANTESVDDWPGGAGYQDSTMAPGGYTHATGLYSNWDDFEEAVLSVFTREFWDTRNDFRDGLPTYKNIDGQLHYISAARGSYGCNPNFPETFRLVEQTEDTISFIMTGYYSDPWPMEGESYEDRDARIAAGWEYSIEYSIRMVRTESGWRFDEFYSAHTDNGVPGRGQRIENPNAPAAVTSSPEPTASPEPVVISELGGMQIVSVGDVYRLIWNENGQWFPVGPATVSEGYHAWVEDFDEDGSPEALFPQDGSFPFTIYDMVGNALVGYPFPNMAEVYSAVSSSSVAAYNPDTGNLTMTFPWGEGDSRRYVTINTTLSREHFAGCEELADGRPLYMSLTPDIDGLAVPQGINTRASIALTDGITTSPQVGYLWFGVLYSDRGFEIRTPVESDFWQTPLS